MQQVNVDDLFKKIALERGIPKYQVEMVYKAMFEMVYETIREGKAQNILLHNFGKFVVPPGKLKLRRPDLYDQIYGDNQRVEESAD